MNRWGNVIFEMDDYNNSFNGTDCVDGVYFYYFKYDTLNPKSITKHGFIHIIK